MTLLLHRVDSTWSLQQTGVVEVLLLCLLGTDFLLLFNVLLVPSLHYLLIESHLLVVVGDLGQVFEPGVMKVILSFLENRSLVCFLLLLDSLPYLLIGCDASFGNRGSFLAGGRNMCGEVAVA